MRSIIRHFISAIILLFFLSGISSFAQVMQSTNYRIQSDSVNVGGLFSSSTNYGLEDTTGEVGTGFSSSTNYEIGAGYQQMQVSYLALSSPDDVTLAPSLGGVTGGVSNGWTAATATTDNVAGYQLTLSASTSPAMQYDANDIDDYSPAGAVPDFSFTTDTTESHFGYSPEGSDIAVRFKDDGDECNVDVGDTALACWDGLSTTPAVIASRSTGNHPTGTQTVIRFRVGLGSNVVQAEGTYTATTTLTLLPL